MTGPRWPDSEADLERMQIELARLADEVERWHPASLGHLTIAGVFIAYQSGRSGVGAAGDPAWLAAVAFRDGAVAGSAAITGQVGAPYVPGLLALREGPLLEQAVRTLEPKPDVVLVNATGKDHPRRAGLALHLGFVLGLPTVGVTDRALLASGDWPSADRGAMTPLHTNGDLVGYRVRTRARVRPLFVHAGWRTDPEIACEVVMAATGRSRTPEPLREARRIARSLRTSQSLR